MNQREQLRYEIYFLNTSTSAQIITGLLELLGFEPEVPASLMEQVEVVKSACASTGRLREEDEVFCIFHVI